MPHEKLPWDYRFAIDERISIFREITMPGRIARTIVLCM